MSRISRSLLLAATFALAASAATAADFPAARTYSRAPAPAPVVDRFDWSGFYFGGNVGYGWGDFSSKATLPIAGVKPIVQDYGLRGAMAGFQVGGRYQVGSVVFGTEFMFDFADFKAHADTTTTLFGFVPVRTTSSGKIDGLGSLTGSIGYTPFERTLLYAKGGIAGARVSESGGVTAFGFPVASFNRKFDTYGWTVGGGLEYAFDKNWTGALEYNHYQLKGSNFTVVAGGAKVPVNGSNISLDAAMLKLNRKINWF